MATSELLQGMSERVARIHRAPLERQTSSRPSAVKLRWLFLDVATVACAFVIGNAFELQLHPGPALTVQRLLDSALAPKALEVLAILVFSLVFVSNRLNLYVPKRTTSVWNEQWRTFEACFSSGLFLTGSVYVLHQSIPRGLVIATVLTSGILVSLRRLILTSILQRRYARGASSKNVIIVGSGPEAEALRHHIDAIRELGYTFKGYVRLPGAPGQKQASNDVLGSIDELFEQARINFVDEIFIVAPPDPRQLRGLLNEAQSQGIDLRLIPDLYDGLAWNRPVEYLGQFPTIPLHRSELREFSLMLKRCLDIVVSGLVLVVTLPLLAVIALVVKIDSRGPVFYRSDRVGRKGRVFKCTKFRTMVPDAETRKAQLMHLNERDGILFKVSDDPRITKIGKFLRKYSLDELPQLFDVLRGEMSLVGPRPPLASEVQGYRPSHLRRLFMKPGITGLWQVQARQDPSFDSYVSLDLTYIESWNVWLDLRILMKTVGVVLAGTGT